MEVNNLVMSKLTAVDPNAYVVEIMERTHRNACHQRHFLLGSGLLYRKQSQSPVFLNSGLHLMAMLTRHNIFIYMF